MHPFLRIATLHFLAVATIVTGGCQNSEPQAPRDPQDIVGRGNAGAEAQPRQASSPDGAAAVSPADSFISIKASPRAVRLFWKDSSGRILGSLGEAKRYADSRGDSLRFLMNAGMYTEDQRPLGLFVQEGKTLRPLNRDTGYGNFYLRPNGVFFITEGGKAGVWRTPDFAKKRAVRWATQSGPMLLAGGKMHPAFSQGSINVNVRNGVGVLPDGRVLMAISIVPVNLWDFAQFFRRHGCENALYLDGAISRAWYPEAGLYDAGGGFGVIVGVLAEKQ